METLLHFVAVYGYLAVFVGTVVWGETIMISAGFLSSLPEIGLNIYLIIFFGILGTLVSDSIWYLIGHTGKKGSRFLKRYEHFVLVKPRVVERIKYHFHKHEGKTIFFSKFIYGTRIIVLIMAGLLGMKYRKFLFYNFLSIVFWAVGMGLLGYYAGYGFLEVKQYFEGAKFVLLTLVVVYIVIRIILSLRSRIRKKRNAEQPNE